MNPLRFLPRFLAALAPLARAAEPASPAPPAAHVVAVNQVGYLTAQSKRFTVPLSLDGATFALRARGADAVLFRGSIRGHLGDFSAFKPADATHDYLITVEGGALAPGTSDPFAIRADL